MSVPLTILPSIKAPIAPGSRHDDKHHSFRDEGLASVSQEPGDETWEWKNTVVVAGKIGCPGLQGATD